MKSSDPFQISHFGSGLTVLPMQVSIDPKGYLQDGCRCVHATDLRLHIPHRSLHNYNDTYSP